MIKWLRSLFAWKSIGIVGVYQYYENTVTKKRKAVRIVSLYGVKDIRWLEGKENTIYRGRYNTNCL
jgi:hypothetical protein